jgi:hypothetical protein
MQTQRRPRFSDDQVLALRDAAQRGLSYTELARRHSCSITLISAIVTGLYYTHIGGPLQKSQAPMRRNVGPRTDLVTVHDEVEVTLERTAPSRVSGWTDELLDRLEAQTLAETAKHKAEVRPGAIVYLRSHPSRLFCVDRVEQTPTETRAVVTWLDDLGRIGLVSVAIDALGVHRRAA